MKRAQRPRPALVNFLYVYFIISTVRQNKVTRRWFSVKHQVSKVFDDKFYPTQYQLSLHETLFPVYRCSTTSTAGWTRTRIRSRSALCSSCRSPRNRSCPVCSRSPKKASILCHRVKPLTFCGVRLCHRSRTPTHCPQLSQYVTVKIQVY